MTDLDFSRFKKNIVRDTAEDIQELLAMKTVRKIKEGVHEVVITDIHEKDGQFCKIIEKAGGSLSFSVIVKNTQGHEQMIYMLIPLQFSFRQVVASNEIKRNEKWAIKNTFDILHSMQIDPGIFRETIIASEGKSAKLLIGVQLVIINSWSTKAVHLEYDSEASANFFVTAMGERFTSGEMAAPVVLNTELPYSERFNEFIAIANDNGYQLATKMNTTIERHPTASNEKINNLFLNYFKKEEPKKPLIVNKTIPAFPTHQIKRPAVPVDTDPDMDDE